MFRKTKQWAWFGDFKYKLYFCKPHKVGLDHSIIQVLTKNLQ